MEGMDANTTEPIRIACEGGFYPAVYHYFEWFLFICCSAFHIISDFPQFYTASYDFLSVNP